MRFSFVACLLLIAASGSAQEKAYRQLLASRKIEATAESLKAFLLRHRRESEQILKWVRQLGDDNFRVRESATTSLIKATGAPRTALHKALTSGDAEVKSRARRILEQTKDKPDVSPFPDSTTSEALVWLISSKKVVGCEDVLLAILQHHQKFEMIHRVAKALPDTLNEKSAPPLLARAERMTHAQQAALLGIVWSSSSEKGKALAKSLSSAETSEAVKLHVALELVDHKERIGLALLADLLDPKTSGLIRSYAHQILTKVTGRANLKPEPGTWKQWLATYGDALTLRVPVELELATFELFARRVSLYSTGFNKGNSCEIWLDGKCLIGDKGQILDRRGINIVAEHGGEIILMGSYDLWGNQQSAQDFVKDIDELPEGCPVAIAVSDSVNTYWSAAVQKALESLGAKISPGKYRHAYYCIGSKGRPKGKAIEAIDPQEGPLYYPESFARKVKIHENGPDEYRKEQRIRIKRGKRVVVGSPRK